MSDLPTFENTLGDWAAHASTPPTATTPSPPPTATGAPSGPTASPTPSTTTNATACGAAAPNGHADGCVPPHRWHPPPDERAPRALQLHDDGMPIKDIARRVNAGTRTVTAWLQDAGIDTTRRDTA